jgi:uncharacterized protein YkwD
MLRRLKKIYIVILIILSAAPYGYSFDKIKLPVYEEELLHNINQYRSLNGLNPLSMDETLNRLAKNHSQYMNKENVLSHDNFQKRFGICKRSHCVENVGWNYKTPEAQIKAWKKSKEHNKNLLNKNIKYAGISRVGSYVTFFACD